MKPQIITFKASLGRSIVFSQTDGEKPFLPTITLRCIVDDEFIKTQRTPCYKKTLSGFASELGNKSTSQCPYANWCSPLEQPFHHYMSSD